MVTSKSERVSAAVTKEEKRRLHIVAGLRNSDVSNQLRENSINDLLAAYEQAEERGRAA